jgi:hypothetical protein
LNPIHLQCCLTTETQEVSSKSEWQTELISHDPRVTIYKTLISPTAQNKSKTWTLSHSAIQMTHSFDRKNLAAYCNQYKLTVPEEYDTMKNCTDYIKTAIW